MKISEFSGTPSGGNREGGQGLHSFQDGHGRTWTVGEFLGAGSWGSSWQVREGSREMVLKLAYGPSDFPADAPLPDGLVAACARATIEQIELLQRQIHPFLPRLEGRVDVGGRPGLLMPRYPGSLKRRLAAGLPMSDALMLLRKVAERLDGTIHGNLRPSNVLVNERGEPVLTDILTPAMYPWRSRLAALHGEREDDWPPEAADGAPRPVWDTWAIGVALYRAASIPAPSGGRRDEKAPLPRQGLDKIELAALRDRVLSRLKQDSANPRFAPRLADRLGSLLNRAVSHEADPSPPYRFGDMGTLRPRLDEVAELVDPKVEDVGHLLLATTAKNGVFAGGEAATFSVTIGCSDGVSGHEDVACGLQLVNLDAGAGDDGRVPVPDTKYTVKAHPSGRLRFDFCMPELPPGRYRAHVAFTIKDSANEPLVAAGEFELRPPPGYVPPVEEPVQTPTAIPWPGARAPESTHAPVETEVYPLPIQPSTRAEPAPQAVEVQVEVELTVGPEESDLPLDVTDTPVAQTRDNSPAPTPWAGASAGPWAGMAVGAPPPIAPLMPRAVTAPTMVPPSIASDRPSHASGEHPSMAMAGGDGWPRPVDWDDARPLASAPYIPGPPMGEDLPSFGDAPASSAGLPIGLWIERGVDYIRRDTYTAFMLMVGAALAFLLGLFLMLKAVT